MKKTVIIILIISLLVVFTGCNKVSLETDQVYLTLHKNGSASGELKLSENNFTDSFGLDINDSVSKLKKGIKEYYEKMNYQVDIKKLSVKKGDVTIEMEFENAEDLRLGGYQDLSYLSDNYGFSDAALFIDQYDLVKYKSGKVVKPNEVKGYLDDMYLEVDYGTEKGSYYTVYGKISLVSTYIEYEAISSDTIFVTKGSGYILFED